MGCGKMWKTSVLQVTSIETWTKYKVCFLIRLELSRELQGH